MPYSGPEKKNLTFDPHHIFPKISRRQIIFCDKLNIGHKFLLQNYGAHMRPWGPPWAWKAEFCTFEICPNPGGDEQIYDIFFGGVWPPRDNENRVLILNSTIFGHKIISKFRLFIGDTEISKSKFLAPVSPLIPVGPEGVWSKSTLEVS